MHPQKRIIIPIFAIVVLLFAAGLAAAQAPQPGATCTTGHLSQLDAARPPLPARRSAPGSATRASSSKTAFR